ncbi:MAG: hypothetical protein K0R19_168 [Bacillota bacterium]|jgi:hypothetical protein|nr:hypothetical protein [Bacillota bacterium]
MLRYFCDFGVCETRDSEVIDTMCQHFMIL